MWWTWEHLESYKLHLSLEKSLSEQKRERMESNKGCVPLENSHSRVDPKLCGGEIVRKTNQGS